MQRPRVIVSMLPQESQAKYMGLIRTIIAAFASIGELQVKNEADVRVLLLPDLCSYGLGEEIDIDVELPPNLANLSEEVHLALAHRICVEFSNHYPKAKIDYRCDVRSSRFTYGYGRG